MVGTNGINSTMTTIETVQDKLNDDWSLFRKIGKVLPMIPAWIVGIVFVQSALIKIYSPYSFLAIIYGYEIVSPFQGLLIAYTLPWIELTLGIMLLSQSFLKIAWLFATLMFSIFVVARLIVISAGLNIPCGCYGFNDDPVNWQNTSITIALLVVSAISLFQSWTARHCSKEIRHPKNGELEKQIEIK